MYTISHEIFPDHQAITFEWSDRQSQQELFRDFSQPFGIISHSRTFPCCVAN
jgi:hypothetical protein